MSTSVNGLSVQRDGQRRVTRALPEEVPVAIVVDGSTQAVMMATPADLKDFATGFALTEGFVRSPDDIGELEIVHHEAGLEARFWLTGDRSAALKTRRRRMAGPVGCGLCGIDSLEEAVRPLPQVTSGLCLPQSVVAGATDALAAHQALHDLTRATHAAGFMDAGGTILAAREDVGRHNALDKLIGSLARSNHDVSTGAFVVTSRLSLEMVQKTAMAGCAILIAVSAPTALAVRLAEQSGITLVAFARGGGFDTYTHPGRILNGASDVA